MRVRFWGVRGTIPVPGSETLRVGGNTACIDVLTSDQQIIILDAGSGIRRLGQVLEQEFPQRIVGTILISHTHWDHIQGLPFFSPLFTRSNRFVILGLKRDKPLEEILAQQIVEPYLPFTYLGLPSDLHVKEIADDARLVIGDETVVYTAPLNHPGGCLGFRIENNGVVFTYCTDTTHKTGTIEPTIVELARDADLLVHDSHFSVEERLRFPTWGHSSWQEAAQVAKLANAKCLALFHFAPDASDDYLEKNILPQARAIFPPTILAREGMAIQLPLTRQNLRQYH